MSLFRSMHDPRPLARRPDYPGRNLVRPRPLKNRPSLESVPYSHRHLLCPPSLVLWSSPRPRACPSPIAPKLHLLGERPLVLSERRSAVVSEGRVSCTSAISSICLSATRSLPFAKSPMSVYKTNISRIVILLVLTSSKALHLFW